MKFFRSLLSPKGDISSNRFYGGLVLLFLLISSAAVAIQTGIIPDVGTGWLALMGLFVGGGLGAKAVEGFGRNKVETEPTETTEQ